MFGQQIIARSIAAAKITDSHGNVWQYHSRSDKHSKIACWVVLFDLLQRCPLLRAHAHSGKVAFGINHTMVDFVSDQRKDLDLVICVPREEDDLDGAGWRTFSDLAVEYGIVLSPSEAETLAALPAFSQRPVGDVLMALEAKAAMTAHVRAAPRLNSELTSAYSCINGSSQNAIAVGLGMINTSAEFVSTDRNKEDFDASAPVVTTEKQPNGAQKILDVIKKLRVRGHATERGFDAIGVLPVNMRNDGGAVVVDEPAGFPARGDSYHYETMILRIASIYDGRFQTR